MRRLADVIIEKRLLFLAIISLISLFFLYKIKDLQVYTKYADLLPQGHEYIKVHNKIRAQFGGANTITMVLQVKEGDIFNSTTLQKIRDISDELFVIPGADRFKVLSLGVDKLVEMVTTSGGFEFHPLMFPQVPQTPEEIEITPSAARTILKAKKEKRRVIAVGTTVVRALESRRKLSSYRGATNFYITPGYKFKVIDALITNFHTPRSTNLILVASFCPEDLIFKAYQWALNEKFRFYSFGDATLIV